ncbi:MAG TPA: YgiQ family radical SAM protein [Methanoculleus sp.]|nr:YgiQ family radical SAM protein [Methanoculleus sp.]
MSQDQRQRSSPSPAFLPTTAAEMAALGWDACDVVIATPDAYVDHPSFAMALLGRFLQYHGYRVGILTQPRWRDPQSFLGLGAPRIAFVVSGGNADSMVLNYTASGKPRKEDQYCEGGNPFFSRPGQGRKYRIRPDRVVTVYASQIRTVCRDRPLIIGGIEASLRRIAHYDTWSDTVRRSVLFDARADLLVYGMGEYPLLEAVRGFEKGLSAGEMAVPSTAVARRTLDGLDDPVVLPSFAEVTTDKQAFAEAFCRFSRNGDRRVLAQQQDSRSLVQFPRRILSQEELDAVYDLAFARSPHPRFRDVPAFRMIRDSITAHRGCFGTCSFCAIAAHQGPDIVSRSEESVLREAARVAAAPGFRGVITDIGGPSANMYAATCRIGGCDAPDCLRQGEACPHLVPGTEAYLRLLDGALGVEGVRRVFVTSGLRFDRALMDDAFLEGIVARHVSGQLKVAPESGSDRVLRLMHKPPVSVFEEFRRRFEACTERSGHTTYLVPYIIVGHPGEGEIEFEETRQFLDAQGLAGRQFQIFTPSPLTRATAMYYLGYDPCTGEEVAVEKRMKVLEERKKRLLR